MLTRIAAGRGRMPSTPSARRAAAYSIQITLLLFLAIGHTDETSLLYHSAASVAVTVTKLLQLRGLATC